jgi:hypothetical protein
MMHFDLFRIHFCEKSHKNIRLSTNNYEFLQKFLRSNFIGRKQKSLAQSHKTKCSTKIKKPFLSSPCSIAAAPSDVARQTKADLASSASAVLLIAESLCCGEKSREAVGHKAWKKRK